MKISRPFLGSVAVAAALLTVAGCATSAPATARNNRRPSPRTVTDTWATETPATNAYVRQDAYGNNRGPNDPQFVTGSFVKQNVNVQGNSADTASPVRIYGQGDLRRRGQGGFSTAESLRAVDPAISLGGH